MARLIGYSISWGIAIGSSISVIRLKVESYFHGYLNEPLRGYGQ